jgi:hypothetical protein
MPVVRDAEHIPIADKPAATAPTEVEGLALTAPGGDWRQR